MKNMFRLIAAMVFLAVTTPAFAQGGGMGQMSREQRLARQKEMLFHGITLDAAQTARVDSIFQDATTKQQAVMQSGGMQAMRSPEGREQLQKITASRNEAIKSLLTEDQKKKFDENFTSMPQMGGRRPGIL